MATLTEALQAVQSVAFMLDKHHRKVLDVAQAHVLGLASKMDLLVARDKAKECSPVGAWPHDPVVRLALAAAHSAAYAVSTAALTPLGYSGTDDGRVFAHIEAGFALKFANEAKGKAGTLGGTSYSDLQSLWNHD